MSDLAVTATPPAAFDLVWSDRGARETSNGPRRLYEARSTAAFDAAWVGGRRSQLRDMGYASKRGDLGWMAQYWAKPSPAEEAARAAATAQAVAASRATDAAVEIPAPEGRSYLPYQRAGIAYAMQRAGTLLGDEMGLGKTIQAVGVINASEARRVLVICPASLKINWSRELRAWMVADLPILKVDGTKGPFPAIGERDAAVVIVNYDVLHAHAAAVRAVHWDLLIADEAQAAKNPKSRRTRALFGGPEIRAKGKVAAQPALTPIGARRKLLLTGTPIWNHPVDLHPLLAYLDPATWGHFFGFAQRYCNAHKDARGHWDFTGASNLPELQQKLRATVMVRREKSEVLRELPAKLRQVLPLNAEDKALKRLLAEQLAAFERREVAIAQAKEDMSRAGRSRDQEAYREAVERLKAAQATAFAELSRMRLEVGLAKVGQVVEHLVEVEHPVVVFAHHHEVVDALTAALRDAGRTVVTVTGAMSGEARQASVDAFQSGATDVIVGTLGAMSTGLTLTRASHVVFAELDWVPATLSQAEDRCHRIGQVNSVDVQHLVFDGSLDARMVQVVLEKQGVNSAALDDMPVETVPANQVIDEVEKARINAAMHARLAEAVALHGALLTPGQAFDAAALLAPPSLPDSAYERARDLVVACEAAAEGYAVERRKAEAEAAAEALRAIEAEAQAEAQARAERKAAAAAEEEARRAAREAADDEVREKLGAALAAAGWGLDKADHARADELVAATAWAYGDRTEAQVLVDRLRGYVDRAADRVAAAVVLPADAALVADPEIREAVLLGCKRLSSLDGDKASIENDEGWSKATSWTGHWLSGQTSLDEQAAAVGLALLRHHQRQLDGATRWMLFGEVERPRRLATPVPAVVAEPVSATPAEVTPVDVSLPLDFPPDDAVPVDEVPEPVVAPQVEPEAAPVVEEPEPVEEVEPARAARAPRVESPENVAARARLVAVGEALYGPRWMTDLARDLGVNDRTVRRYDSGATPIPATLWADIAAVARRRRDALDAVISGLNVP